MVDKEKQEHKKESIATPFLYEDKTMPTASDYVSGPFGPGKIYQKQPAVSSATCGIHPAALHYYVMRYDKKCSCHYLSRLLSHQKELLARFGAKIIRTTL